MIVCGISGWNDADLAIGAVESARAAGLEVLYLDGWYETYATGPDTPAEDLERIRFSGAGVKTMRACRDEATKKTALIVALMRRWPMAEWALILDTDERIEGTIPYLPARALWATLQIHRQDIPASSYPVPRLLRLLPTLHFRGPRDYDVWLGQERLAYLDGEEIPSSLSKRWYAVPREQASIRHDRHLRSAERVAMTREYLIRRRERYPGVR